MNKQEFEEKIERTIEDAAAHMEEPIDKAMVKAEQKIETAADRFDKSVNRAAKSKAGKRIIFFVNLLIAVALFISGFVLLHYQYTIWAIVCFSVGGLDVLFRLIEAIIFKD